MMAGRAESRLVLWTLMCKFVFYDLKSQRDIDTDEVKEEHIYGTGHSSNTLISKCVFLCIRIFVDNILNRLCSLL